MTWGFGFVNERDQQLAYAREDERLRHLSAKRTASREASLLEAEHLRMTERRDIVDRMDDTDFQPGALI
jgi:hypothetical protein